MKKVFIEEHKKRFSLYDTGSAFNIEQDFKREHLAVRYANDHGIVVEGFEPRKFIPKEKDLARVAKFFDKNMQPLKVRCYDNCGESFDRYTIVFTGDYLDLTAGEHYALGASDDPEHPQGFGQHLTSDEPFDRPSGSHLGLRVKFNELPSRVQAWVLHDYIEFWDFNK